MQPPRTNYFVVVGRRKYGARVTAHDHSLSSVGRQLVFLRPGAVSYLFFLGAQALRKYDCVALISKLEPEVEEISLLRVNPCNRLER